MEICEKCGKEHDGSYGSGRFCSSACARSFSTSNLNHNELKDAVCINCNNKIKIKYNASIKTCLCDKCYELKYSRTRENFKSNLIDTNVCINCGNKLNFRNLSGYCYKCYPKFKTVSEETRKKLSNNAKFNLSIGKIKPWKSRDNISSFELFWMNVLDSHNIQYKHDFTISKKSLGIDELGYYKWRL